MAVAVPFELSFERVMHFSGRTTGKIYAKVSFINLPCLLTRRRDLMVYTQVDATPATSLRILNNTALFGYFRQPRRSWNKFADGDRRCSWTNDSWQKSVRSNVNSWSDNSWQALFEPFWKSAFFRTSRSQSNSCSIQIDKVKFKETL